MLLSNSEHKAKSSTTPMRGETMIVLLSQEETYHRFNKLSGCLYLGAGTNTTLHTSTIKPWVVCTLVVNLHKHYNNYGQCSSSNIFGIPCRTRTCDPWVRNPLLCPAELRGHHIFLN